MGFRVQGRRFGAQGVRDSGFGLRVGILGPKHGPLLFLGGIYGLGHIHPRIAIKGPYQGPYLEALVLKAYVPNPKPFSPPFLACVSRNKVLLETARLFSKAHVFTGTVRYGKLCVS